MLTLYGAPRALPVRYVRITDDLALVDGRPITPDDYLLHARDVIWCPVVAAPEIAPGETGLILMTVRDVAFDTFVLREPDNDAVVVRERIEIDPWDLAGPVDPALREIAARWAPEAVVGHGQRYVPAQDTRGDAERTAQVEEDAATRRELERDARDEQAAEDLTFGGIQVGTADYHGRFNGFSLGHKR